LSLGAETGTLMPCMDGFSVLKELESDNETPVMAISAKEENAAKSLGTGACDFISKPFDVNYYLAKKIQNVFCVT